MGTRTPGGPFGQKTRYLTRIQDTRWIFIQVRARSTVVGVWGDNVTLPVLVADTTGDRARSIGPGSLPVTHHAVDGARISGTNTILRLSCSTVRFITL